MGVDDHKEMQKVCGLTSQLISLEAEKAEQSGHCMTKSIQDCFIPVCVEVVTCLKPLPQTFQKPSDLT